MSINGAIGSSKLKKYVAFMNKQARPKMPNFLKRFAKASN